MSLLFTLKSRTGTSTEAYRRCSRGKDTKKFGINKDFCSKIWNLLKYFLSLQRQNISFDYPGKFPERASRIRHYPIYKAVHQMCGFDFVETASARHNSNTFGSALAYSRL